MLKKLISASLTVFLITSASILTLTSAISWPEYATRLTTHRDFDGIPSITETNDGKLWAIWTKYVKQNYYLYYKTSSDAGSTWSAETKLTTNPGVDSSPSICQDLNGTVWVVWASSRSGGYDLYYKTSPDGGSSWSNDTRLTTDPDLDKLPSITQTGDGKIWVAWSSDRTGDNEIFYKTYNGLCWSNETRLTIDGNVDTDPSILQTFDHRLWIFWSSRAPTQTATDDIFYKYSRDYGITWSESIQFTTDPYDDLWVSTTESSDLEIWVIWTSDRSDQPDGNWDIYYKSSLAGDVNEDGRVNIFDMALVSTHYGSKEGDPNYDPDLDLNGDGYIDIRDLSIIGRNYGATR